MKEITHKIQIKIFDNPDNFSGIEKILIEKAILARENAYAKYSKFRVGSAVLLENGEIITGSNQENAIFPIGLCAERVALGYASHNYPEVPVIALALSTQRKLMKDEIPVFPCGNCRQALIEQESRFGNKIKLLISGSNGRIFLVDSARDILPFAFTGNLLENM